MDSTETILVAEGQTTATNTTLIVEAKSSKGEDKPKCPEKTVVSTAATETVERRALFIDREDCKEDPSTEDSPKSIFADDAEENTNIQTSMKSERNHASLGGTNFNAGSAELYRNAQLQYSTVNIQQAWFQMPNPPLLYSSHIAQARQVPGSSHSCVSCEEVPSNEARIVVTVLKAMDEDSDTRLGSLEDSIPETPKQYYHWFGVTCDNIFKAYQTVYSRLDSVSFESSRSDDAFNTAIRKIRSREPFELWSLELDVLGHLKREDVDVGQDVFVQLFHVTKLLWVNLRDVGRIEPPVSQLVLFTSSPYCHVILILTLLKHPSSEQLKEWAESPERERRYTDFSKVAQRVAGKDRYASLYRNSDFRESDERRRLLVEGRASTTLFNCLSNACVKGCHEEHTAYLSLKPEDSESKDNRKGTDSTNDSNPSSPIQSFQWKCHMAFESTDTDSLIWLKVESSLQYVEFEDSNVSNETHVPGSYDSKPDDDDTTHPSAARMEPTPPLSPDGTKQQGVKRKRDPSPHPETAPVQKKAKTDSHQPTNINTPLTPLSTIELCPGILVGQYTRTHTIMKLADGCGNGHRISYLPMGRRPAEGTQDKWLSFSEIMEEEPYQTYKKLWILTSCRLIAEAVLKCPGPFDFDPKDRNQRFEQRLMFRLCKIDNPKEDGPVPYLRVIIENLTPPSEFGDAQTLQARRKSLLLSLGWILLLLVLDKQKRPSTKQLERMSDGDRLGLIKSMASDTESWMPEGYRQLVEHCADFFQTGQHQGDQITDSNFKERYYKDIVKPLRKMEMAVKKITR
jgi:hypothetical protein